MSNQSDLHISANCADVRETKRDKNLLLFNSLICSLLKKFIF